jgi:UDPglucose 6-dehydrogenase
MLGLSFKPETDDMRDAPAAFIASSLLGRGAKVRAFDPAAMVEAGRMLPDLDLCKDVYEVCEGADILVITTEWNEFRMLDLDRVKQKMREAIMLDLRNIYDPEPMRAAGFQYECVGR